jgi:hypothetical protein
LGPAFKYSSEDGFYQGVPIADSAVFMRVTAPTAMIPFWPFTTFEHVDDIWFEFSDSIKTAASQAPLSYWINFFSTKLGRMPEHYYLPHPPENKLVTTNEYLWTFDKYCFEIYDYTPRAPEMKKSLGFSAYLGPPR